jgi:hypothetical protein
MVKSVRDGSCLVPETGLEPKSADFQSIELISIPN